MRLVTEAELRYRLDLGNLPQYVAAAEGALDNTTLGLENDLRTEFDLAERSDVFRPNFNDPSSTLKLKCGFVATDPAPVVLWAVSQDAFNAGETEDLTADCSFNYEKGFVTVDAVPTPYSSFRGLGGSVLTVTYTAGFSASEADPSLYDPLSIPAWLRDLALLLGTLNIANHPAVKPTDSVNDVSQLKALYNGTVTRRSRYAPHAILPV